MEVSTFSPTLQFLPLEPSPPGASFRPTHVSVRYQALPEIDQDSLETEPSESDRDPSETILDPFEIHQYTFYWGDPDPRPYTDDFSIFAGNAPCGITTRKRHRDTAEVLPHPKRRRLGPSDLGAEITFSNLDLPIDSRGHFSDLYLGTHRTAGKVALKRSRRRVVGEGHTEPSDPIFHQETEIWMGLRHIHILQYLGTFEHAGHLYFVSPYMKNGTLSDWIRCGDHGQLRLRLIGELTDALSYLHFYGIVHGDVKGSNVLLSDDLHVKLCDFGLTKLSGTRTNTTLRGAGSIRWQSPELCNNESKTFKSDVYAYSMTIVEVLTGKIPLPELLLDCAFMMAVQLLGQRPTRVPETSPDGTSYAGAWDVAERGWHRDASQRILIGEAAELLKRVRKVLRIESSANEASTSTSRIVSL